MGALRPRAKIASALFKILADAGIPCVLFGWLALWFFCEVEDEWVRRRRTPR